VNGLQNIIAEATALSGTFELPVRGDHPSRRLWVRALRDWERAHTLVPELDFVRHKYAGVSDPRAKAAIAEYADKMYGRGWRMPVGWPRAEFLAEARRPEHARLLRHIDQLNPKVRRIA
jgi:hypothetical protein